MTSVGKKRSREDSVDAADAPSEGGATSSEDVETLNEKDAAPSNEKDADPSNEKDADAADEKDADAPDEKDADPSNEKDADAPDEKDTPPSAAVSEASPPVFQISEKLRKMHKRDADIFGTSNWTNRFHFKGCPCCD